MACQIRAKPDFFCQDFAASLHRPKPANHAKSTNASIRIPSHWFSACFSFRALCNQTGAGVRSHSALAIPTPLLLEL